MYVSRLSLEEIRELMSFLVTSDLQDHLKVSFEVFVHLSQIKPTARSLLLRTYFGLASKSLSIEEASLLLGNNNSSLLGLASSLLNFCFEPYYKERRQCVICVSAS